MVWRIAMLGGLRATCDGNVVDRFPSRQTALLLAYLALRPDLAHPREILAELLWPEAEPEAGRNRLKQALASLRRQLEPPGEADTLFFADRSSIRLHSCAADTDVAVFEQLLGDAASGLDSSERTSLLSQAVDLYGGELLPGHYEEWLVVERTRLAERQFGALMRLSALLEAERRIAVALRYARLALTAEPSSEEALRAVMRLCAADGRPAAALRLYKEVAAKRGALASETQSLARQIGADPKSLLVESAPETVEKDSPVRVARSPVLPRAANAFFGREVDLAHLVNLLNPALTGPRVVTLTGAGGTGKSRLAQEAATRLVDFYDGAVWFIPLADLSDARMLRSTIAVSVDPNTGSEPSAGLTGKVANRPALLVLDNLEQLGAAAAVELAPLLSTVPSVRVLATSRRRLRLAGERVMQLAPLPAPDKPDAPERLLQYPSVQLFVDRARAARPDFHITAHNAEAIAALCQRLDGLPLALELAAARALTMTPAQMLARLGERLDTLRSRKRSRPDRHMSLWAAAAWSYDLLPRDLRRLFALLAVFRGGCTAEAVGAVEGEEASDLLESLTQLAERSLIVAEEAGDEMRFRMLDTLREFAAAQLPVNALYEARIRHSRFFLEFAGMASTGLESGRQQEWMQRIEWEHQNLRAAFDHLCDSGEGRLAQRLGGSIWRYWMTRGHAAVGCELIRRAIDLAAEPSTERAEALNGLGALEWSIHGADAAEGPYTECLALRQALGDRVGEAAALNNLGVLARQRGDLVAAEQRCSQSLAILRELGTTRRISLALNNLGSIAQQRGDHAVARGLYEESLGIKRELGDAKGISGTLINLSICLRMAAGDLAGARVRLAEAARLIRELGDKQLGEIAFVEAVEIARAGGDFDRAAMLLGATSALRRETGGRADPEHIAELTRYRTGVRSELGGLRFDEAFERGEAWGFDEALNMIIEN